jgi:hypothetical protein
LWKTALPPRAFFLSSREIVFCYSLRDEKLLTLCLNRKTREILWQREILERNEQHHPHNTPASPTPVTDGERSMFSLATLLISIVSMEVNAGDFA